MNEMERFTVRVVDDDEREAGIECYECPKPARFVEELLHPFENGAGFVTRLYYCDDHRDCIRDHHVNL